MQKADIDNLQNSDLYLSAKNMLLEYGEAGTELFQRKFLIGYTTAYRLLDLLAEEGLASSPQGVDPKVILIKR